MVTAYDFESGRPVLNSEWGPKYYEASFTAQGLPEPSSLRGSTLGTRAAENMEADSGACKLIDGCSQQGHHLRELGGGLSPPKEKEKKKKERNKEKKEKRGKKEEKRKKGTINNVKLLHIKCCFFQFFNSPVALKSLKKFWPPKKKLKWRPW